MNQNNNNWNQNNNNWNRNNNNNNNWNRNNNNNNNNWNKQQSNNNFKQKNQYGRFNNQNNWNNNKWNNNRNQSYNINNNNNVIIIIIIIILIITTENVHVHVIVSKQISRADFRTPNIYPLSTYGHYAGFPSLYITKDISFEELAIEAYKTKDMQRCIQHFQQLYNEFQQLQQKALHGHINNPIWYS